MVCTEAYHGCPVEPVPSQCCEHTGAAEVTVPKPTMDACLVYTAEQTEREYCFNPLYADDHYGGHEVVSEFLTEFLILLMDNTPDEIYFICS